MTESNPISRRSLLGLAAAALALPLLPNGGASPIESFIEKTQRPHDAEFCKTLQALYAAGWRFQSVTMKPTWTFERVRQVEPIGVVNYEPNTAPVAVEFSPEYKQMFGHLELTPAWNRSLEEQYLYGAPRYVRETLTIDGPLSSGSLVKLRSEDATVGDVLTLFFDEYQRWDPVIISCSEQDAGGGTIYQRDLASVMGWDNAVYDDRKEITK